MRISDLFTDEIIDADIRKMMGKNAPKLPLKDDHRPQKEMIKKIVKNNYK